MIPYLGGGNGLKVVLITSRTNRIWIFPKGNPIKGKTARQTARQEAFEEAGIRGKVLTDSYSISYIQHGEKYKIKFFPMKVDEVLDDWPESRERKRKIAAADKALSMLSLDDLRQCLRDFLDNI